MKKIAPLLILIAGSLWGSMGLFVRRLNYFGLVTMDIVALRAVTTAVLIFLYLFVTHRELLKIKFKDLWCFLGTGICSIVFFNYCYFRTITLVSLSVAAVLLYTAPAIVMILSVILFHEKITKRKMVAVILAFSGCLFVSGVFESNSQMTFYGFMVGLGAGVGYALYSIFSRYALEKKYNSWTITFYTFLIAAIGTLPFVNYHKVYMALGATEDMPGFILLFGLVSTVLPYLVYTIGLQYIENSQASVLASIEPVVATILGVLVFQEQLTVASMVGGVLVLCSVLVMTNEKVVKKVTKRRLSW